MPVKDFFAIDPGDVHNGVAYFRIGERRLLRSWTADLKADSLFQLLAKSNIDGVVIEEFRLYPELARAQGYSTFPTCEIIGVVKYICAQRELPCYLQGASVKRKARRVGARVAPFAGSERMIGSGRSSYRGWDFGGRTQHERDATAHGVWWATRNTSSPLWERDYAKNGGIELICDE